MKKSIVFSLMLLGVGSLAMAARSVDETTAAAPDGLVSVELIAGSVAVVGWDRNEVHVTGTLGDDVEDLDVTTSGDHTSIEVKLPRDDRGGNRRIEADLEIRVPRGSGLEIESVSADVSAKEVAGEVRVESVSGEVELDGQTENAEAETVSGRIVVRSDHPLREGKFQSVSGDVKLTGALAAGGRFRFETVSGDVELRLPSDTSAAFDVETFSGDIENELGPSAEKSSDYVPSKKLSFSVGSGAARVDIETFSGGVALRAD